MLASVHERTLMPMVTVRMSRFCWVIIDRVSTISCGVISMILLRGWEGRSLRYSSFWASCSAILSGLPGTTYSGYSILGISSDSSKVSSKLSA